MKLNEVNEELKAQLHAAQTVDDFMKVCEENGIEVTREAAEKLYEAPEAADASDAADASEKRVLADDELELVAGGTYIWVTCDCCGKEFNINRVESRKVDDGCGTFHHEYICPYCGTVRQGD